MPKASLLHVFVVLLLAWIPRLQAGAVTTEQARIVHSHANAHTRSRETPENLLFLDDGTVRTYHASVFSGVEINDIENGLQIASRYLENLSSVKADRANRVLMWGTGSQSALRVVRLTATGELDYVREINNPMGFGAVSAVFPDGSLVLGSYGLSFLPIDPQGNAGSAYSLLPNPNSMGYVQHDAIQVREEDILVPALRSDTLWLGAYTRTGSLRWSTEVPVEGVTKVAMTQDETGVVIAIKADFLFIQFLKISGEGTLLQGPTERMQPSQLESFLRKLVTRDGHVALDTGRNTLIRWSDGTQQVLERRYSPEFSVGDSIWTLAQPNPSCLPDLACQGFVEKQDKQGILQARLRVSEARSLSSLYMRGDDQPVVTGLDWVSGDTSGSLSGGYVAQLLDNGEMRGARLMRESDVNSNQLTFDRSGSTAHVFERGAPSERLVRINERGVLLHEVTTDGVAAQATSENGSWLYSGSSLLFINNAASSIRIPLTCCASGSGGTAFGEELWFWQTTTELGGLLMSRIDETGMIRSTHLSRVRDSQDQVTTVSASGDFVLSNPFVLTRYTVDGNLRYHVPAAQFFRTSDNSLLLDDGVSVARLAENGTEMWRSVLPAPDNSRRWDTRVESRIRVRVALPCSDNGSSAGFHIERWDSQTGQILSRTAVAWNEQSYGRYYCSASVNLDRDGDLLLHVVRAGRDGVMRFFADQPRHLVEFPGFSEKTRLIWADGENNLISLGAVSQTLGPTRIATTTTGLLTNGFE